MDSPSSPADLHTCRDALRAGTTTQASLLARARDAARSPASRHAWLDDRFDAAITAAARPRPDLPLAGLPVSVKDLFDEAGQVTRAGSVVLADAAPAARDATAVARLKAAGGVVAGRTNMTEFAFSGVGVNPHHGTPANPADAQVARIPGGSSSGAAVSVATGAAVIGLGSDTGGSIRIPAALCGIVGFKNTARLTPADGAFPLSTTLDTVCAMTRSVRDAIVAHEILAARTVTRATTPLSHCRLAVVTTQLLDDLAPPVARAFESAVRALRDAGAQVTELALPALQDLGRIQATGGFSAAESHALHRALLAHGADRYDPRVRARIERGAAMMAWEYIELHQARRQWIASMERSLAGFDAVLSPTVPLLAPPIAEVAPGAARDDTFFRVNALLLRNTSVVNMLDGCALSLPCHPAGELPVGLMIWHAALRDDTVLHVGRLAEGALAPLRAAA